MYKNRYVDIPLGLGGYDGNKNFYQIPPTRLSVARNIVFRNDAIVKAPGFSKLDANGITSTLSCYGGHDWRPTSANQYQVSAWSNGAVYRESGGNIDAATLGSGFSFTEPVIFVTGGHLALGGSRSLYMFSKNVRPQQVAGTTATFSNLTADSTDWSSNYPAGAIYHDARIYAFGLDNAPHNYYISALLDHGDFSLDNGGRTFSIFPGEGEEISAMVSFGGTVAYAFKRPYGVYRIDTLNVAGYSLPAQRVRDDVGCAGPNAVIKVGADVFFVSTNGRLYSLASLAPEVDARDADITAKFNLESFIDENLDKSRARWIRLAYNEATKELYYFFTSKSSTNSVNDRAIVFNLESAETTKISVYDQGEYFNAVWRYINSDDEDSLYAAGYGGNIFDIYDLNRNVDGSAFTAEWSIPETDLRWVDPILQGMNKRFDMLELTVIPTGNYDATITFTVNGASSITRTVNLSDSQDTFDDAEFDSAKFAGARVVKRRIPINAWGETISINVSNNGLNEEFEMVNLRLHYKPTGQLYESA